MIINDSYGKYKSPATDQPDEFFDVASADKERLAARLGEEPWTERAAGRDESLAREVSNEIKQQLGSHASEAVKPE